MVDLCPECGNPLKKNAEFCMYCGKNMKNSRKVSIIGNNQSKNDDGVNKQSRYLLNDSQRRLLVYRIIPLLIIGCVIWLLAESVFSFLFKESSFTPQFIIIYVTFVIADLVALLLFFITARKNYV
ncbi:MAG: zinc ribbon domain-containing protein, partial [Promethearchaeota archaeon]